MDKDQFLHYLFLKNPKCFKNFPNKVQSEQFMDDLFDFLFSCYEGKYDTEQNLIYHFDNLKITLSRILLLLLREEDKVQMSTVKFFDALPAIYEQLQMDAEAVLKFDPAAESIEEVMIAYPGFYATAVYRIAHQLYLQEIPLLPRLLSEYAHSKTGIDIHPGARIGHSFSIDHGTGLVIGQTTIIGDHVKIYQGVTLGAVSVEKSYASIKRHPTIEDNVIIYSGATILGGDTVIGHDSIIGGNVWLTYSVAPYSIVYHQSEIKVRDKNPLPEGLNFVI